MNHLLNVLLHGDIHNLLMAVTHRMTLGFSWIANQAASLDVEVVLALMLHHFGHMHNFLLVNSFSKDLKGNHAKWTVD